MSAEVRSEIAGTVWKCTATVGQRVKAGQPLIIVESMKMEIPVSAPLDGTVEAVLVAEGEMIEEDQVIAQLASP